MKCTKYIILYEKDYKNYSINYILGHRYVLGNVLVISCQVNVKEVNLEVSAENPYK